MPLAICNQLMKLNKTLAVGGALLGLAFSTRAQYVIGSFQGASDTNNSMWSDPNNGDPIASDPNASFVALGVSDPNGPLSLEMAGSYAFGNPSLTVSLNSAAITAFNSHNAIQFTFSVSNPSAPTGPANGFSQIYNLALNAPGYGYNNIGNGGNAAATWGANSTATGLTSFNQNGMPNFFWFPGSASVATETVTFDYGPELAAVEAGGEGFVQFTFQGNIGSAAPENLVFNNVALVTIPEPGSCALFGLACLAGVWTVRRRHA